MSECNSEVSGSLTPILDRETPIPFLEQKQSTSAQLEQMSGRRIFKGLAIGASIAIPATLAFSYLISDPWVSRQHQAMVPQDFEKDTTLVTLVLFALRIFVVAYAIIATHVIGHLIGGLFGGFRFRSLKIGPLQIHRGFGFSVHRGPVAWLSGTVWMTPVKSDHLTPRALALLFFGSLANILAGCTLFLFPVRNLAASEFAVFSIAIGLINLLPFPSLIGASDGARIWRLLRGEEKGERWLALLRLHADLADGVPAESLSTEYLQKAIAVQDRSLDTVSGHVIAYLSAMSQQKPEEAGRFLEVCLMYAASVMPDVRADLMSTAAVHQARVRKRADLAEQWLAEIPGNSHLLRIRLQAEAAVLEAHDDIAGCIGKLEECEKVARLLADMTDREMILRSLVRWRFDLQAGGEGTPGVESTKPALLEEPGLHKSFD